MYAEYALERKAERVSGRVAAEISERVAGPDIAFPDAFPELFGSQSRLCYDEQLQALAHAGAPLRRVIAAICGQFMDAESWKQLGFARVGDYARERLGLSARWLQDLARVERRLQELPGLEAALTRGELPWSKVRLLARLATR